MVTKKELIDKLCMAVQVLKAVRKSVTSEVLDLRIEEMETTIRRGSMFEWQECIVEGEGYVRTHEYDTLEEAIAQPGSYYVRIVHLGNTIVEWKDGKWS